MSILGHFDSSTRSMVRVGLNVCTLILTVKHGSCGRRLERGHLFFPLSLCGAKVHSFTPIASTWLHNSKCGKIRRWDKREELDEGKKAGWCHPFFSNKDDLINSKNIQTLHLFPSEKPKWWAAEVKIKMAVGRGKPNQCGVSIGNLKKLYFCCQNRMVVLVGR